MARARKKSDRNLELIDALATLERDRGMPAETIFEALEAALGAAYPKTPGVTATHARIEIDRQTGEIRAFEQEVDEETEEVIKEEFVETSPELGRIAAQTAKHVIHQKLREAERQIAFEEYEDRAGEIVTGIVEQHDPRFVILNLGKAEAIMPYSEQIPRERYEIGDRVRAYIVEVREGRGPTIVVSRSHPGLVRKLFEMEVPEIQDGLVEIKAIAREAGHRTKIAVASNDTNIDPVGACVGPKGMRVRAVVNELRGEKIDVVAYTEDTARFVSEALQPARVRGVSIDADAKTATVIVADRELSLAIGKEGQNARLAARLTGWRIDIKSESQRAAGEAQAAAQPVFEPTTPERRGRRTDAATAETPVETTETAPAAEGEPVAAETDQPPATDGDSAPTNDGESPKEELPAVSGDTEASSS